VPRLVVRLVKQLVVDYSASRRLVRRASGCLGMSRVSSRGSSHRSSSTTPPRAGSSSTTSPPPRIEVPRHVAWLVTRLVAPLVVDYSASAGSSRGSLRRLSWTTSPTPRIRVSGHVARLVTRLVIDYSVRRDFVLRPHWLYSSHAVRRGYLSRGNTGSTSSTPRATTTSSSGRIPSIIHLD
jgi:hypothetical protein